jgi:hypothetical protein
MAEHIADRTPDQNPAPSRRFKCRHIHAAGHRCGSPCLRGEHFCYFHHLSHRPLKIRDGVTPQPADTVFTLPHIEDHSGIHLALADVLARIADRTVDPKRAGLLLYGLNTASLNLRRMNAITDAANIAAGPNPHPSEVNAVIQDLELDPDLGPLAPVTEHISPEVAATSLRQRFMDFCNSPARVCRRCEERDRLDANRAEAGRLILEREREEPNNLEIRRLADQIRATLPDLKASADDAEPSEEAITPDPPQPSFCATRRISVVALHAATNPGAPSSTRSGRVGYRAKLDRTCLSGAPSQTASPSEVGMQSESTSRYPKAGSPMLKLRVSLGLSASPQKKRGFSPWGLPSIPAPHSSRSDEWESHTPNSSSPPSTPSPTSPRPHRHSARRAESP